LPADVWAIANVAVVHQWRVDAYGPGDPAGTVATAYRFATELLETRFVSDATFAAALDALGERGLVNLMVLMGHSNILCAQQALAGAACEL
jgi:hypothetical protein